MAAVIMKNARALDSTAAQRALQPARSVNDTDDREILRPDAVINSLAIDDMLWDSGVVIFRHDAADQGKVGG